MVSIRKPQARKSSVFTFRNVVLAFIGLQGVNLMYKIVHTTTKVVPKPPNEMHNVLDGSKGRLGKIHKDPPKPKPLPHKIERIPDADQNLHQNQHAKKDVRVQKPPEVPKEKKHPHVRREEPAKDETHQIQKNEVKLDNTTGDVLKKHGSGPTKVGYVVDMVYEREHAPFRNEPLPSHYPELELKVGELVAEKALKSCEYIQDRQLKQKSHCRDADTRLIVYNDADFARHLCGKVIEPKQAIRFDEHCNEVTHLFSIDNPPISGTGMPAIVVQSKPTEAGDLEDIQCDVPCKFEQGMGKKRYIAGTNWKLLQTTADPYFHDEAKVERTAFRKDEYYSTTSFQSSVPLSFYSFDKYNLRNRPAIDWDTTGNKATYVLDKDCSASGTRRQKWISAVQAGFDVAAYGKCHHNADPGNETTDTLEGRVNLMKRNRVALAFEAGTDKDHVTKIVWESLLSGAVPAVLGAQNIVKLLPTKSVINAGGYNNWDKFAEYVKTVSGNKTEWNSYHAWRSDEKALQEFEKRFNFTRISPECRTCRWAYAKMYGLGWDHEQQVVRDTHIPRRLCLDKDKKLVSRPFREVWVERGTRTGKEGTDACTGSVSTTSVELDSYKISRTVVHHDGVTDILIDGVDRDSSDEDVVLRLEVDVQNSDGAYFRDTHTLVPTVRSPLVSSATIQDDISKVTALANFETKIYSPDEGAIEITVLGKGESLSEDHTRRIRVIVEDISQLHDKMTEYSPSSFGKQMTKDFVDPLEVFYADS